MKSVLFCLVLIISSCGKQSDQVESTSQTTGSKSSDSAQPVNSSALLPFSDSLIHEQADTVRTAEYMSFTSKEDADIGDIVDGTFTPQEDGLSFVSSFEMEMDRKNRSAVVKLDAVAESHDASCFVSVLDKGETKYLATLEGVEPESAFITGDQISDSDLIIPPNIFEDTELKNFSASGIHQVLEGTEFSSESKGTRTVETYALSSEAALRTGVLTRFGPNSIDERYAKADGFIQLVFEDKTFQQLQLDIHYQSDEIVESDRTYIKSSNVSLTNEYSFDGTLESYDVSQPLTVESCDIYDKIIQEFKDNNS